MSPFHLGISALSLHTIPVPFEFLLALPFTVRRSSHDLALDISVIVILLRDFLHPWPLLTSLVPKLEPLTPTLCKSQNDICSVKLEPLNLPVSYDEDIFLLPSKLAYNIIKIDYLSPEWWWTSLASTKEASGHHTGRLFQSY